MATPAARQVDHVKYDKISESTSKWVVPPSLMTKGRWRAPADEWVVTEKVHGANFCLDTADGTVVRAAKRSDFLVEGEDDFFGWEEVLAKYAENARQAYRLLATELPGLTRVTIYGELFGGGYAEESNIPSSQKEKMVQTEIVYCPWLEFYAYDVAVHAAASGGEDRREYLAYDRAMRVFKECRLFYAEPLFVGPFEKAVNFDVDFVTTIPKRLGLPQLGAWNKAEGVVVKPLKAVVYVGLEGKQSGQQVRAIVKVKAQQFIEKVMPQQQKASKGKHAQGRSSYQQPARGEEAEAVELLSWLGSFVNKARVTSASSKLGGGKRSAAQSARQNVAVAAVEDALLSASEEFEWPRYQGLSEAQRTSIRDTLVLKALSFL